MLRSGAQLVEREIADSNGDVKVRVSVDLNRGFNQRLKVVGAETGLPAPGTPARPINCTSEGESQTEDRERAARRGARSKRKAKPSPRNDGNDDVADRRGDFDRDNGARGSGDTMPGTRRTEGLDCVPNRETIPQTWLWEDVCGEPGGGSGQNHSIGQGLQPVPSMQTVESRVGCGTEEYKWELGPCVHKWTAREHMCEYGSRLHSRCVHTAHVGCYGVVRATRLYMWCLKCMQLVKVTTVNKRW